MEDGHALVAAQVAATIMGEESVYFALGLELSAEALGIDGHRQAECVSHLRLILPYWLLELILCFHAGR